MNISSILKQLLLFSGASVVGIADLNEVPEEARNGLRYGVAIGVALNPSIIKKIDQGPTLEYHEEYHEVNKKLSQLSSVGQKFLQDLSYEVASTVATQKAENPQFQTALPHKTVATRAGLGWIGKCALMITEEYGSAIRLSTLLTNAPLDTANPVNESRCSRCSQCVNACPGKAPSGELWSVGKKRDDFFDVQACFRAARLQSDQLGIEETICGRCIVACPYTKQYLKRMAE